VSHPIPAGYRCIRPYLHEGPCVLAPIETEASTVLWRLLGISLISFGSFSLGISLTWWWLR
jgi:hypothetical protein